MNAVAEVRTAVSVALLGPADAAREQLRQALVGLGADLVFEGEVRQGGTLVGRAPQVLIVNLEPGVEDDLDALQELLDSPDTSVVFNEGEVSSQLTGWDLARWARHLASKVLGVRDTLPPLPTGAERLPELSVLPEPGRPISPSQQQDHLRFDDFAEEALGHRDEVPASPRLELAPQKPEAGFDGLDFDFSPVQTSEPVDVQTETLPSLGDGSDALESMDLSELFEQDLSQVTPDDMLLKLQQAMGLDIAPQAAERAPAITPEPARASAVVEDAPATDGTWSPEMAVVGTDADDAGHSVTLQTEATAAQDDYDFSALDFDDLHAPAAENRAPSAPDPAAQPAAQVRSTTVEQATDAALTPLDFSFDPVAFEAEIDPKPASTSANLRDTVGSPVADSRSEPQTVDTFDFTAFDAELDALDAPLSDAASSPRFGAEDAALGGTLTLDSAADDDEIARLAAALDAQPSLPAAVDLPPLEFDFPRDRGTSPAASLADSASEKTSASREPVEPARVEKKGFGVLSLKPLDDGFIDPSIKAPETPIRNFDFSHLNLSLEPIEEEAPPKTASAPGDSSVATMRDGAWLRDLHEVAPQSIEDATTEALQNSAFDVDTGASAEASRVDLEAGFDFVPADAASAPSPAHRLPAAAVGPLEGPISRVVVLCASIGGPDAVRGFLSEIPPGFPALFVVVQHLENGYFERLAQQLQKTSKLPARVPMAGLSARDGEVLVVASGARFRLNADGAVELADPNPNTRYRPCIDDVLHDVADTFGPHAHAIVFSGMAADAVEGSVYLSEHGGVVWAQDPETCVVSSMVDGARARGVVDFVGSPAELARQCLRRYT
ncbi:MAG: chemotaxis protein CheB [Lysobacterales bacterium]